MNKTSMFTEDDPRLDSVPWVLETFQHRYVNNHQATGKPPPPIDQEWLTGNYN